jgi:biotin synthase
MRESGISAREARELLNPESMSLASLMERAGKARRESFGDGVRLCAIINAKSGRCPERCAYCSQSRYFRTSAPVYPLRPAGDIVDAALQAEADGATEYSIVTSGRSVRSKKEIRTLIEALTLIGRRTRLGRCASLGEMRPEALHALKEAGLQCCHHNVETAPSFHPRIVATHGFDDEVRVIDRAREAGLKTCCGGIFGMGESPDQRVELIMALRDIDPDRVPLNFLNPIAGTPLEGLRELSAGDCLRIIAVTRLAMPRKPIIICGGRDVNLGERQGLIFDAGASAVMTGDYLTTTGRSPDEDRRMIRSAGYRIAGERA